MISFAKSGQETLAGAAYAIIKMPWDNRLTGSNHCIIVYAA